MPDTDPIETRILKGIASRVANQYIGAYLPGLLGLGGGDSPALKEIGRQLKALHDEVARLREDFTDFARVLLANDAFMHAEDMIHESVQLIEADYAVLSSLTAKDQRSATDIQNNAPRYHEALGAIHTQMTADSLSGGNLLTLAAQMLAAHITPSGYDPSNPTPLLDTYRKYENYFRACVATQLKATVLMQNAYNARGESDRADDFSAPVPGNVGQYAIEFLNGVQLLTATYHHDQTLLDMFTGPQPMNDPLRLAHVYVQRYPAAAVARIWTWLGSGPGFNIAQGNSVPDTLTLTGDGGTFSVQAEGARATYTFSGDTWTAARFAIPPERTEFYTPTAPGLNVTANPGTGRTLVAPPRHEIFANSYFVDTACTSVNLRGGVIAWSDSDTLVPQNAPFTIECWCNPSTTGGVIFSAWWDRSTEFDDCSDWLTFVDGDGTLKYGRWGRGDDPVMVGLINSRRGNLINSWHHVAMRYDPVARIDWFVDGEFNGNYGARLGRLSPTIGGDGPFMRPLGLMNEFRVWRRVLSDGEISTNMHRTIDSDPDLVAACAFTRGVIADRRGAPPIARGDIGWTVASPAPAWLGS